MSGLPIPAGSIGTAPLKPVRLAAGLLLLLRLEDLLEERLGDRRACFRRSRLRLRGRLSRLELRRRRSRPLPPRRWSSRRRGGDRRLSRCPPLLREWLRRRAPRLRLRLWGRRSRLRERSLLRSYFLSLLCRALPSSLLRLSLLSLTLLSSFLSPKTGSEAPALLDASAVPSVAPGFAADPPSCSPSPAAVLSAAFPAAILSSPFRARPALTPTSERRATGHGGTRHPPSRRHAHALRLAIGADRCHTRTRPHAWYSSWYSCHTSRAKPTPDETNLG